MSDIRAISGARSVKTALEASARVISVSDDRVGGSVLLRIVSSLLVAVVLTLRRPSRNRATPVWISSADLVRPTNSGLHVLERSRGLRLSFVCSTEVHMGDQVSQEVYADTFILHAFCEKEEFPRSEEVGRMEGTSLPPAFASGERKQIRTLGPT